MREPTLPPRQEYEIRQFREAGISVPGCALYFSVSEATVVRVLAKLRLTFGPEKLPRRPVHLYDFVSSAPIPELARWLKTPGLTSE